MKKRQEILASGFGGQGVVRLGQIVGMAAMRQGFRVTMLKSHGTEQRGGYVRAQVVISPDEIDSPLVENPDFFCAFSSAAYKQFSHLVQAGTILYDPAMIEIDKSKKIKHVAVPAKDTAVAKFGRPIYANTIMLGALAKVAEFLDKKTLLSTMLDIIPKYKEQNKNAFEMGYRMVGVDHAR